MSAPIKEQTKSTARPAAARRQRSESPLDKLASQLNEEQLARLLTLVSDEPTANGSQTESESAVNSDSKALDAETAEIKAAAGIATFELSEQQVAKIVFSRGRRSMPSAFADDMSLAASNRGHYYGVPVTPAVSPLWITAQLRKAARQCGLKSEDYSIHNRSSDEKPHVAYVVHPAGYAAQRREHRTTG